ncbi:MAG: hypothetical protein ABW065_08400 [Solirubrobacterales bacterium]
MSGEFPVSGLDSNNKLVEGPDGNEWLTLSSATADVARITPAGVVTEYDLGAETPAGIAVAAGKLWITRNNGVTSFEAKDPETTKLPTAIATITGASSIVLGPDGNLWAASAENLVRISPTEPETNKSFSVPGLGARDIDVAGSLLVVAGFGTESVVTATPTDPPVTKEVKVGGGPQGVAGGPGGQVAYTQPTVEPKEVGLFTPPSLTPQKLPVPGTDPFGIVLGQDGAYWSAEGNGDRLLRVTTAGQLSDLKGFAPGSRPTQLAPGPGGTLWVALSLASKVGRVTGVEASAPPSEGGGGSGGSGGSGSSGGSGGSPSGGDQPRPAPETEILSGPGKKLITESKRIRVAFRLASPQPDASFECRLVRIAKKKGNGKAKSSAEPAFRACASPRVYRLTPGRYRFEVRAVLDGIPDPTRAKRPFRIVRAPR